MKNALFSVLSLIGQLGFIIALPAAGLAYVGALLDKHLHTSPLFILLGIFLAIITSSAWIYRFVKQLEQK